ncbi:M4 family metallopeptidase [Streptomyces sp. NBC_00233]|uniref:M4 family metallopeptidase n=1 Tax=Streptomyces sp. NBC_00233 TaxID=2975686 RepID=UPI0022562363|nr:M4 family metallopeptidase [Streptomyces sp. NBC_00233]MCX5233543.1 M4 family metallopeptidase [Streptomyces sp. NBC_00233]
MRHSVFAGALSLTVAGLLINSITGTANASDKPGPASPRVGTVEAVRDATTEVAVHPNVVQAGVHDTFEPHAVQIDKDNSRHVHLGRTHQGLPVLGGDVIVHSAPNGDLRGASLTLKKPLTLSVTPKVGRQHASKVASGMFKGVKAAVRASLVVDAYTDAPSLAWEAVVDGTAPDQSPSHLHVLVNAQTGKAGRTWDTFQHATGTGHGFHVGDVTVNTTDLNGSFQLKDPLRGSGETRDANNTTALDDHPSANFGSAFTDADNVWGTGALNSRDTVAVDAHYGIQATWDYYKNVHGRNGIRNDGVGARSFVHYGVNFGNAGWDDETFSMIYGDGKPGQKPFTGIDVAGHEMSHGVTSATADLNYFGEAGGLNEATSDIFGTLVEFSANNPADTPDYLIGEKIDPRGNGTPLRWMDDPKKDGEGSQTCWTTGTKNLNPHYSSGVGNHFFYMLAVGSGSSQWGSSPTCGGAAAVTGIGNDAAGKIWYRALTSYLTSTSTYADARTATIKAAIDLYGATSTQCTAVEKAWTAAAVGATPTICGTPTPPAGNLLLNPGFESGNAAWTTTTGVITNASDMPAHGGTYKAWLNGYGSAHTDTLSQSVTIPSGRTATLGFWLHVESAETTTSTQYDKLTVRIGNTTLATYSNLNKADGYTKKSFDLSAYAGSTVTLNFTGTEDLSLKTSFVIDDTEVTTS